MSLHQSVTLTRSLYHRHADQATLPFLHTAPLVTLSLYYPVTSYKTYSNQATVPACYINQVTVPPCYLDQATATFLYNDQEHQRPDVPATVVGETKTRLLCKSVKDTKRGSFTSSSKIPCEVPPLVLQKDQTRLLHHLI